MSTKSMQTIADLVLDHKKYMEFLESKNTELEVMGLSKRGLDIFKQIIVGTRSLRYRDVFDPNIDMDSWDNIVREFSQTRIVNSLNDIDLIEFLDFLLVQEKFTIEEKIQFIMNLMHGSAELIIKSNYLETISSLGGLDFLQNVIKFQFADEYYLIFFDGEEIQELEVDKDSYQKFHPSTSMTLDMKQFLVEWRLI